MTEQRRVQFKDNPNKQGTVLAEYTNEHGTHHLWIKRDEWATPQGHDASNWEDVPKYDPAQVPQVGETWAYGYPTGGAAGFLCVGVDEGQGVWHFIDNTEIDQTLPQGWDEKTKKIFFFTRGLPETYMKKRN